MFTKIDKDYAKSTSVCENTWKTEVRREPLSPNTLNRPVKGTKMLFVGNFGRERKYTLAWIHPYGMNSLTFLAIRHKGEHNHSNWPILSRFSEHTWGQRGSHWPRNSACTEYFAGLRKDAVSSWQSFCMQHTYRAPLVHEG